MAANISSQSHQNPNSKCEEDPKIAVPKCVLFSAPFNQTAAPPLLIVRTFKPNLLIPRLHHSIMSAANAFLRLISSFASHNAFLSNLSSLSAQFHQTCHQIRCRNLRNVKPFPSQNFAAILPGDSVAGIVVTNGILNFLNIYNTLLVVRLVLTWFPNTPPAIVSPLSTLCDPYLNIFRGIIPPLGGTLDLSPILAFLVLNAFTSTAAALPCELPSPAVSHPPGVQSCEQGFTSLTRPQKMWMRRFCRNQPKRSSNAE